MGYNLHITRKDYWATPEGPMISEAEWRQIIEDDPELTLDTETQSGDMIFASWNDEPGALGYWDGEITAKNPDEALIDKMVAIAQKLSAIVQGDDGESYPNALASEPPKKTSFWRRLFGG